MRSLYKRGRVRRDSMQTPPLLSWWAKLPSGKSRLLSDRSGPTRNGAAVPSSKPGKIRDSRGCGCCAAAGRVERDCGLSSAKSERTVKRWEPERGLPMHRLPGKGQFFGLSPIRANWINGSSQRRMLDDTELDAGDLREEAAASSRSRRAGFPCPNPFREPASGGGASSASRSLPSFLWDSALARGFWVQRHTPNARAVLHSGASRQTEPLPRPARSDAEKQLAHELIPRRYL